MRLVAAYIRHMPPGSTCHQFCLGATETVRKAYVPTWKACFSRWKSFVPTGKRNRAEILDFLRDHPEERLCASAVIFSRLRREIWLVGDCQCLVGGELIENPKPYEQRLAEMRAAKIRELLAGGMTAEEILANDRGRAAVIPEMLREMREQNRSYAVIDGFRIPEERVVVIALDFRPWEIVLASDGYPELCPTLAESEAQLEEQRRRDPLNIGRFKATKGFAPGNNSFDDRSYIRFTV